MWESTNIVTGTVTGSEPSSTSLGGRSWRAVENASRMSPLECSPAPPVRAIPNEARWAIRRHWCGSSGASVATIDDDRARARGGVRQVLVRVGHDVVTDHAAGRDAGDAQTLAPAVVGLHEHADCVAAVLLADHARGRTHAALEAVADHPGAAADRTLLDRPVARLRDRLADVLGAHVMAVDVVERPVIGLPDHGQRPVEPVVLPALRHRVGDQRVADDADAVRVGERDRGGSRPDSRTHSSPVSSPLPLSV